MSIRSKLMFKYEYIKYKQDEFWEKEDFLDIFRSRRKGINLYNYTRLFTNNFNFKHYIEYNSLKRITYMDYNLYPVHCNSYIIGYEDNIFNKTYYIPKLLYKRKEEEIF